MPIVPDKYRDTPEYDQVRELLIDTARQKSVVTYVPFITRIMGLDEPNALMARELGLILGEISEDEHLAGRPLLSAVGISSPNRPSKGFFDLARELGKPVTDEDIFLQQELQDVYAEWSR